MDFEKAASNVQLCQNTISTLEFESIWLVPVFANGIVMSLYIAYFILIICHNHVSGKTVLVFKVIFRLIFFKGVILRESDKLLEEVWRYAKVN